MLYRALFCIFSLSFVVVSARIQITNPFTYEIDQCKDVCSDSFFLLPLVQESQSICQRGCRFFNIIDAKEEGNLNDTSKECHSSCTESYSGSKSKDSCIMGCDTMSKKKQSDMHKFFPYLDQYTIDDQEFDSIEADILLDPLIRKQVQAGYNLQYKIPEAYIRTMPIDENDFDLLSTNDRYKEYKNNMICTSLFPITVFVILLIGLLICSFKIAQLLHLLKNHDDKSIQDEFDKIMVKCNDEGNKCFMHNCKQFNYNLYEVPGLAFVISLSQKNNPDVNEIDSPLIVHS